MKIKLLFLLAIFASLNASALVLNLDSGHITDSSTSTKPERIIEYFDDHITVTYKFQNINIYEDDIYTNTYNFSIPALPFLDELEKPAIPITLDRFPIPDGSNPSIEIVSTKYIDLNYEMSPSRPPRLLTDTVPYSKDNIPPIKPYSGFFPTNICTQLDNAIYRKQKIARIAIYPIQYNFQTKTVRTYSEIVYQLNYGPSANASGIIYEPASMLNPNCKTTSAISTFSLREPGSCVQASSGYLLISAPQFKDDLYEFVKWKKRLGYNVTELYDSDWTPEKIKTAIKEQYNKDESLMYLLIVGDHSIVPAEILDSKISQIDSYLSDVRYFCLDGDNDFEPDLYCSRIPIRDNSNLTTVLEKIIWYESSPSLDPNFYKSGTHYSFFEDGSRAGMHDGIEDGPFVVTSEKFKDYLTTNYSYDINRVYDYYSTQTKRVFNPSYWSSRYSEGGPIPYELSDSAGFKWDGTADDLISSVNDGISYLLYSGHGIHHAWGNEIDAFFRISDIEKAWNYEKTPVIFNLCCLTGKHDEESCISRSWLTKKNGGAIGIFAPTQGIYYSDLSRIGILFFNAIWPSPGIEMITSSSSNTPFTPPTTESHHQLGSILNYYIPNINKANTIRDIFNSRVYTCFGDPSMYFRTEIPEVIDSVEVNRTKNGINVYTNGKNAYIGFWDPTTGKSKRFFGTEASYISETENAGKYLNATVYTPNSVPYTDLGEEYRGSIESSTRSQILGYKDSRDHTTVTIEYILNSSEVLNSSVKILIVDLSTGNIISSYPIDKSILDQKTELSIHTGCGVLMASLMIDGYPVSNLKMYISK